MKARAKAKSTKKAKSKLRRKPSSARSRLRAEFPAIADAIDRRVDDIAELHSGLRGSGISCSTFSAIVRSSRFQMWWFCQRPTLRDWADDCVEGAVYALKKYVRERAVDGTPIHREWRCGIRRNYYGQ